MMRILVVEDDSNKERHIRELIEKVALGDEINIEVRGNVFEATQAIRGQTYDLLLLDLHVPMRKDTDARKDAGAIMLQQIVSRKEFHVPSHVIGLTGFDTLAEEYASLFQEFTWALVKYEAGKDGWEQQVARKLEHIANWKKSEERDNYDVDIAIVTALEFPELTRVRECIQGCERKTVDGDDTFYYCGELVRQPKRLRVVAASAIQMGMPAATALSMKICAQFRPRILAMVGIAAGVNAGVGDILVADKAWDYGSGKSSVDASGKSRDAKVERFEPAPNAIPLDAQLVEKLRPFVLREDVLKRIEIEWSGSRSPTKLAAHLGPIASGASVLENRPLIERIKSHDRKLIGVEMETYGVFLAARLCPSPRPKAISVKSVCDRGDIGKNNDWQDYAAFTSARFFCEFALECL